MCWRASVWPPTAPASPARRKRRCARISIGIRDAIDQYNADKGHEPADLATLVSDGYIRRIPEDPFTKSADTWQTEMGETDPSNPSALPGIHNVKSGAEGTSLDGTPYSEF